MSEDKIPHTKRSTPTDDEMAHVIELSEASRPLSDEDVVFLSERPAAMAAYRDLQALRVLSADVDVDTSWNRFAASHNLNETQQTEPHSPEPAIRPTSPEEAFRHTPGSKHPCIHRIFLWGALSGVAAASVLFLIVSFCFHLRIGSDDILAFQAIDTPQGITLQTSHAKTYTIQGSTQTTELTEIGATIAADNDSPLLCYKQQTEMTTPGHTTASTQTASALSAAGEAMPPQQETSEDPEVETHLLTTPRGMDCHIILADGSSVWLNEESSLEYPSKFIGKDRNVTLHGEGYFQVAKDPSHPFIVHTDKIETRVLGTEFNIRSYDSTDTHITLVCGNVEVSSWLCRHPIILQPGQDAHYRQDGSFEVRETETDIFTYWKEGYFYFDNAPLCAVMQSLGRWYNMNVVFEQEKMMDLHVRYYCIRRQPIEEAVVLLNRMKGIHVKIADNTLYVR